MHVIFESRTSVAGDVPAIVENAADGTKNVRTGNAHTNVVNRTRKETKQKIV